MKNMTKVNRSNKRNDHQVFEKSEYIKPEMVSCGHIGVIVRGGSGRDLDGNGGDDLTK